MSVITTNWYISSDGSTWVLCSTAGVCQPVLTLRTNGLDELTWQMPGDFLADPAYAYASTIYLARGVTTDGATVYTCRLVGRITSIPRQAASAAETLTFRASGAWWWLEQITYAQQWQTMRSSDNALINFNIWRVVFGQTDDGVYCDSGAQISAAVAYAIAVGAPIVAGTIDTLAVLPYSEHICVRCADVIRQCLRFQPDVCCWFDYNNRNGSGIPVPKFYCRTPANLTPVNVAVLGTDADSVTMTPRYDLQMPGVSIMYEQANTYNGKSYRNVYIDNAPSPLPTDPRIVGLYFEMAGSDAQTVEQEITVEDYPSDPYTDKAFWRAILPWLDPDEIADADLAIQNVTRDGVSDPLLPSYLTDGQITPWMTDKFGVKAEEEIWEADISYSRKSASGTIVEEKVETKHVSVKLLSTDGLSQKYTTLSSYTAAEPINMGLAAQLYASWSRLHWDGAFRLTEDEASFQAVPGNLVNLTGGLSAWSTMAALVQDVVVDLTSGYSQIKTGTCGRLEADSLVALFRAAHFRRFSVNYLSRTDAASDSAGRTVSGGKQIARQVSDSADPGLAKIKRWTGTDSGSRAQAVVIDPSSIAFANGGDAAVKTMQIREIRVLERQTDGTYKAKLAQVLCSDIYNAGEALGGGISLTGTAAGQVIIWDGSAWVVSTPSQIMAIVGWRLDKTGHKFQIKTQTAYVLAPGSVSEWSDLPGGDTDGGTLDQGYTG